MRFKGEVIVGDSDTKSGGIDFVMVEEKKEEVEAEKAERDAKKIPSRRLLNLFRPEKNSLKPPQKKEEPQDPFAYSVNAEDFQLVNAPHPRGRHNN